MKFSQKALCFVALFIVAFTAAVLWLNHGDHMVSDALIVGVFSIATGECGALAFIRNSDNKHKNE
jgi:uncharacterized membrane protein YfcA